MATARFLNVSQEETNKMKENAVALMSSVNSLAPAPIRSAMADREGLNGVRDWVIKIY